MKPKPKSKSKKMINPGHMEVSAEFDGETWTASIDFADVYDAKSYYTANVISLSRDGEALTANGKAVEVAWVYPMDGDLVVDGALVCKDGLHLRRLVGLTVLSAAIRRAALNRLEAMAA